MAMMTPAELEFYRKNGYLLHKKQLLSAEKMAGLTAVFEEQLAAKGDKLSDELDTPHFRDARLFDYLLAPEVLDLVEAVTGPDIVLWSSHFICKDPFKGRATPWHEDSAYWKGKLDNFDNVITIWLALDPSNRKNGCLRVIPGSQSNGFSAYEAIDGVTNTFNTQAKGVDESKAVYFELERGECSLHDSRILHGAEANTSPTRRCGYTMRYFPSSVRVIPEKTQGHKVYLARGKDKAGNTYAELPSR
ncbi:MAG: phytanoyl-CoA dioxygenase family protein [candidate division FCPU426 bacterium]